MVQEHGPARPDVKAPRLDPLATLPHGRATMFPIRDHNPSRRFPIVTIGLIAACVVVHLYAMATKGTGQELGLFYYEYGFVPIYFSQGEGYAGMVTSMFLHGDLWHLGGNMLFLWIVGDNIEDELGSPLFALFYVVAGIAAAYAQFLSEPLSRVPMIGASGAVAGVMGAYLLMFPKAKIDVVIFLVVFFRILPIPAFILLALWFGMQVFGVIGASPVGGGGVAYWAHIGGFIAGIVLIVPVWLRRGGQKFWSENDFHAPHPEATYGRTSIPEVKRK